MRTVLAIGILLAATTAASADMSMSFTWGPTKKCFDSKSPPITMSGVPEGTKKIKFVMVDKDAPSFSHGGGSVNWTGKKSLPYGAFRYKGPCPPSPHTYQFTAKAVDGYGKTLATARASRRFP